MIKFQKNPSLLPLYLKAIASMAKPKTTNSLPNIETSMLINLDSQFVDKYKNICEYQDKNTIPITLPYALAGSMQLWLWTRSQFPVRVIGAVHVKNTIHSYRLLIPNEKLELRVRIGECRQVRLGTEHDVITELIDQAGLVVWESVSTNMAPDYSKSKKTSMKHDEPNYNQVFEFEVPHGIGIYYGRLCGDINPIHLHNLGAKLFGFKTAIAHGMWAVARALSFLEQTHFNLTTLDVRFRRPIPIGKKVKLHSIKVDKKTYFAIKNLAGDITHIEGSVNFEDKLDGI